MSSKRQKTIHNYFSDNTSETTEIKSNESQTKQMLLNLIIQKHSSIGFKPIDSNTDHMKTFKRIIKDNSDTDYIKCNTCPAIIKCNANVGTNGAKRHKCIINSMQTNQSIERHLYKCSNNETKIKSNLTDSLVLFIAKDMRPINIINGEGFKLVAKKLLEIGAKNPNIPLENILPTNKTISNHIQSMYEKIKKNLIEIMKNTESIGITCDHWTHDVMKTNYITLTIQYISYCEIRSRVLATIQTSDKTSLTTRSDVKNILNDFDLNEKYKYFTTDNCSAMILAFSDENWISCSAHNINLLHKNSFKVLKLKYESNKITETIKTCKQLVKYFKQSCIQNELETKLKQSISIRWDSKYLMLDSIQKNLSEIKNISLNNRKVYELVMKIDDTILCQLIVFLKPFYELRLALCKENTPTLHLVLPTKQKMLLLCNPSELDSEIIKTLKSIYKQNIQKYIKITELHIMSTVLYPPLRELKNLSAIEQKTQILSKLSQLLNEIKTTEITRAEEIETNTEVDLCLKDFIELTQTRDNSISDKELENYINSSLNFDINSPILLFWEQNQTKYPRLYRIARRLLSIPATNLSSERNFSAAGLTLTDHRSNLSPDNVNHLLFIRSNFDLN